MTLQGGPTVEFPRDPAPWRIFLVAGEHSGDALGGRLMTALEELAPGRVEFSGLGGPHMTAAGLQSIFPMREIAVMGARAIAERLPQLIGRMRQTARAAIAAEPHVLVIIDAPEFTHRVARRVRKARSEIPIVDYVSPSVWAWRPGRARRMRAYVDEVLALLPFEPEAHRRLGGPLCTYVGHPLVERWPWIRALDTAPLSSRLSLSADRLPLVVLPGSRRSEVARLMRPFGETMAALTAAGHAIDVIIPTVDSVRDLVVEMAARWPVLVHVVTGDEDKFRAFKLARAALAASGTVTLELALAGCPMVVAYRVEPLLVVLRPLIRPAHFALANLVLGERAFPELMQEACTPKHLAPALADLLHDSAERRRQLAALARVPATLLEAGPSPGLAAARRVLANANPHA